MKRPVLLAVGIAVTAIAAGPARAGAAQRQPGQWENVTTIRSIDVPGAPPEAQAQFRAQVGQPRTQRECLTVEQARDPLGEMRRMMARENGPNCTFTDPVFADGRISLHGTCSPAAGGTAQVSLEGTFTETTLQADMTMTAQPPTGAATPGVTGLNMTIGLQGRRIGDCPPAETSM